jgi:hypothetical protein
MIHQQRVNTLGVCLGLGLIGYTLSISIPAKAEQPSTFQNSCKNTWMHKNFLAAECRTRSGDYRITYLYVRGIENRDGNLRFTDLYTKSSFQHSCKKVDISGATLKAVCRKVDGTYKRTAINLPGIENIDGKLKYSRDSDCDRY